jgi:hypothetical protein
MWSLTNEVDYFVLVTKELGEVVMLKIERLGQD